jgi:hypothetical protein
MTYADGDIKDFEALLHDDEFPRAPAIVEREKHTRRWTLIHMTVLLTYSLLFAFLLHMQMNTVKCLRGHELIYCMCFDEEYRKITDPPNQPLGQRH